MGGNDVGGSVGNGPAEATQVGPAVPVREFGNDPVREAYARDGFAIVRGAVSAERIGRIRAHCEATIAAHPGLTYAQIHAKPLWFEDPFYVDVAREPVLVRTAQSILGPDIALFAAGYIVKEPHGAMEILWHQDGSYWPLEPMEVCTLWLAITESDPGNGCMRVLPGTQHLDLQALQDRSDRPNLLQSSIDESLVDENRAVDLVLAPGDISLHHPNIVHGSNANRSDRWRINMVIRVIAASTNVTAPDWPGVFPLAGAVRGDVNRVLGDPVG